MSKPVIFQYIILIILFLSIFPKGNFQPLGVKDKDIKQENITSISVYEGTLNILENRVLNDLLSTYSNNQSLVYTSSAGLAGTAYNLLLASDLDTTWVGAQIDSRLVSLASDIGNRLINLADVNNATHAIWSIHSLTNQVDLSLEFGLSGIARMFVKLYNSTLNSIYADIATRTLRSIRDLTNGTSSSLYFDFDMLRVFDNKWYPFRNFLFYDQITSIFSGQSFGSAGVAQLAMEYLRDVDTANNSIGMNLLERSLYWIWSQRVENGTELSFQTNKDNSSLISTSKATGVSGIGNLYLDLYSYTGNNTYKDLAWRIGQFLNGTISKVPKTHVSWINKGEIQQDFEIGIHQGISSSLDFLNNLLKVNQTEFLENLIISFANSLRSYGKADGNSMEFGERVVGNIIQEFGSTSYGFGGGGVFGLLNKLGTQFNNTNLLDFSLKLKRFLLSQTKVENGNSGIIYHKTSELEFNPLIGLSGSLLYLGLFTTGLVEIDKFSVNFGKVLTGSTSVRSIMIANIGEQPVSVNWSSSSPIFSYPIDSITVGPQSSYLLNISFSPLTEVEYDNLLNVTSSGKTYTINIQGTGFDLPIISAPEVVNNTLITTFVTQSFSVTASDTSGVQSVHLVIRNENETEISRVQMSLEQGTYKGSWDTTGFINGTYIIDFLATDILGNGNTLRFVFQIGVFTPGIEDIIFSENTFNYIIIGIVILVVIAVFVTRRLKS